MERDMTGMSPRQIQDHYDKIKYAKEQKEKSDFENSLRSSVNYNTGLFKGGLKNKLSNENNKKILKNTFNNNYVEIDQLLKVVEHSIEDTSGNGSEIHCDNGFN